MKYIKYQFNGIEVLGRDFPHGGTGVVTEEELQWVIDILNGQVTPSQSFILRDLQNQIDSLQGQISVYTLAIAELTMRISKLERIDKHK